MKKCNIHGLMINMKNTAAGIRVDLSGDNSGMKGSVNGTLQVVNSVGLTKYKFSSSTVTEYNTGKPNTILEAVFNNVILKNLTDKTEINGSVFKITVIKALKNGWSGVFVLTYPDGRSIKIHGVFEGRAEVSDDSLKSNKASANLKSQNPPPKKIKSRLIPVIIQLTPENRSLMSAGQQPGSVLQCRITHSYPMMNAFATKVDSKKLHELLENQRVHIIWRDRKIKALLDIATPAVNAPSVWRSGFTGRGIGIAILDTGIYRHPDLISPVNRIIGFKDFINGKTLPYDDNGHGTHVAGDAAGNGTKSAGRYQGPARQANLIGIKVLDRTGSGSLSGVLAGVQYAINNKARYNIRVMNLSLGATAFESYATDPLCKAVEKAWAAGIVVCAAAGNSGPYFRTIDTPGIDPVIITVGAENTRRTVAITDDSIPFFFSRGPTIDGLSKPDVVAPGVNIRSLRAPGSYLDRQLPSARLGSWYFILSGTSMATPICSGVAALIIQKNPRITPAGVKNMLKATARKIGTASVYIQGSGLIDAFSSVRIAKI